ncbi:PDDEXK nuclease domain-containing protein [Oribacterium sp. WCC10]|uniref:PDDEXK nuclease domain-containing protein n=1 Tax=Oribacterium sp. WCC10 TaxID=1855343 RepID=UPI0008E7322F|nr:PDDEXK nuclease domain-containing protein [Oribacterium sp. WCC10]SFG31040.1 Predicted nuclease of restriction endonuclease-like (RecB) superfamily, DUF1016 family [Oribacterium sp. WCC10]
MAEFTNKPFIVHSHDVLLDDDYISWMCDIKQRFKNSQIKAAMKVNSEQLLFNWQLGRDLVAMHPEEKWGNGIVEQISLDLQNAFPNARGFSARNLWFMKQWYSFYALKSETSELIKDLEDSIIVKEKTLKQVASVIQEPTLKQPASEMYFPEIFSYVPWMHHVLIIQKCKTIEEALFYIKRTVEEGLSRNALDNSIRADMFHSMGGAITNFDEKLPVPQGKLAKELLKEKYDLGFIALPEEYDETELEDAIEQRMTRFLLELGAGWAFVGRQKEMVIAGKTRKIDLLFYHIYLRCYVVIELKVKPFEPEFAGKLNFYVNAVNELIRREGDNPSIGLLICKDMDKTEVQMAFEGITTPMGVATYDNIKVKEIQEHLPSAEEIQKQIELAEEEYKLTRKKGH